MGRAKDFELYKLPITLTKRSKGLRRIERTSPFNLRSNHRNEGTHYFFIHLDLLRFFET